MKAIACSILFASFLYAFVNSSEWRSAEGPIFCLSFFILSIVFFFVTLKHLLKKE